MIPRGDNIFLILLLRIKKKSRKSFLLSWRNSYLFFRPLITLCSMKITTKKTEEWREVPEEGLKGGLKKYVLFKGDIPSKKVQYRDPAGKSYKSLSEASKLFNKPKSTAKETKKEKKSKKRKSDINHCPETSEAEVSPYKRRSQAQPLPLPLVCRDCRTEFTDEASLANHKDLFHPAKLKIKKPLALATVKSLELQCEVCDFIGESKSKLKKHQKKEHKQTKGRGGKTTPSATSAPRSLAPPGPVVGEEKEEEEEEEDLYCEECGVEYRLRSQLEAHLRTVHKMAGQRRQEKIPAPTPVPPPVSPPPSLSTARSRGSKPRGVQKVKEEEEEMEMPGLYCEECGVEYSLRSQLEAHMRSSHQMTLPPSLPNCQIKKGDPIMNYECSVDFVEEYYEDEEQEEEEEFYDDDEEFYYGSDIDQDVVEVEDVSSSPARDNKSKKQILRYDSSDEDSDDSAHYLDEEDEPEEITLDGDDDEEDEDIIIEDVKQAEEEEDRRRITQFESCIGHADSVAKIIEEPKLLQQVCATAWWAQPGKWKPSNTWEVWNAKVAQVCTHYKVKDIGISKDATFASYDEFDRIISPELMEKNPFKSFKILYTWKKAKWFSLLDPVIPENMKIVEETLEDDE